MREEKMGRITRRILDNDCDQAVTRLSQLPNIIYERALQFVRMVFLIWSLINAQKVVFDFIICEMLLYALSAWWCFYFWWLINLCVDVISRVDRDLWMIAARTNEVIHFSLYWNEEIDGSGDAAVIERWNFRFDSVHCVLNFDFWVCSRISCLMSL